MRKAPHSFLLLLMTWSLTAGAQIGSLTPVVIGSAGGFSGGGGAFSLSYSVGEPVTVTTGTLNLTLTQGFEQPSGIAVAGLHFTLNGTGLTCQGANDGSATPLLVSGSAPFTYSWNTHPSQITQTATRLSPGMYYCTITDAGGHVKTDSVRIPDNNLICGIHAYSGFTPNGDGKNDTWIIDNLEAFSLNSVSVFDRWGDKVWYTENYDNAGNVFKGTDTKGGILPDGTYFYLIRIGDKEQRGWVEISR